MFSLRKTAVATELPVTLAEVKAHLRVTWDDDDALLSDMMNRAAEEVEAACSIPMGVCGYVQTLDEFPMFGEVRLGRWPLVSVTSVKYYDTQATQQTLATSAYYVASQTGRLLPNQSWPYTEFGRPESVEITFTAGLAGTLPPQAKSAFLLIMAQRFNLRGDQAPLTAAGNDALVIPPAAAMLLRQIWQGNI